MFESASVHSKSRNVGTFLGRCNEIITFLAKEIVVFDESGKPGRLSN